MLEKTIIPWSRNALPWNRAIDQITEPAFKPALNQQHIPRVDTNNGRLKTARLEMASEEKA
ncbi:hypothetical protein PTKU46_82900 [Paraburkholderia terrae]